MVLTVDGKLDPSYEAPLAPRHDGSRLFVTKGLCHFHHWFQLRATHPSEQSLPGFCGPTSGQVAPDPLGGFLHCPCSCDAQQLSAQHLELGMIRNSGHVFGYATSASGVF